MEKQADVNQQVNLALSEWTTATPQSHPVLARFSFEEDPSARQTAQRLTQTKQIIFHELSTGLKIETSSVVGSICLGRLSLTIVPKIDSLPLMRLLRFAYGLRNLEMFDPQTLSSQHLAFQDLLIFQLINEVEELLARGLLRNYLNQNDNLASPAGRVDFSEYIRQGGLTNGSLPCIYYNRLENCLHNQVILAGLLLAVQLTNDLPLRSRARRLARLLANTTQPVRLHRQILEQVDRESNRLTEAYRPAIKLVALLLGETGSDIEERPDQIKLQGFLFDMNRFFQALLSRLLTDYLEGFEVEDEHKLKGFLAYVPGYELPGRQNPLPRPDFAVLKSGKLISLFDAKYRDLWSAGLPRDMLYQLIVYALSQQNSRTATILYPSLDETAREARIQITEPLYGLPSGQVMMRPVNLVTLETLVTLKKTDELKVLAHQLIFGMGHNPREFVRSHVF